tara:strand:- start:430 stop:1356 length:927 start_codon:yes stop_codon:yes gene_type:complete
MLQILRNYSLTLILFFLPINTHSYDFEVKEVENNIFVHFGVHEDANKLNNGDICNIGFIIGKKSVLVVDPGGTPKIAEKLIEQIKKKTKLPISHVVITHGHPDHFLGSTAFSKYKPIFIGHENLKRSLDMNFNFYKLLQSSNLEDKNILKVKPVLPGLIVKKNQSIEINLGERKVSIQAWSSGHTDNDLSVYDKNTKVFWSENIFVDRIPSITASILGWKKNLEITKKMEISKIVPGHGPIMKKDSAIEPMLKYFNRIIDQVRILHKNGLDLEYAQKNVAKKNLEGWLLFDIYHKSNITKAYTELEWE